MRNYFDSSLGDQIVLTCSLPKWARSENAQSVFATMLCALAQSTGATSETNSEKIGWFVVNDLALHPKGKQVVCVYSVGSDPEPEPEGELNLDDLLKEGGDGQDPPSPSK